MRTYRYLATSGLVLSLTFLVAAPAIAQPAPETPVSLFGEVLDVRVVNLEVVVTRGGERVTGLRPEDFVLTVDGQEVPIEYFTEVHGGTAAIRGDEADVATIPALAPGTPVSTSYLLFIDEYFTVKPHRDRVLSKLIEQLPVLNPEDRMAVVAFDGKKLEMLSTWSRSIETLTRVLEGAMERPAYGLQRLAEYRSFEATRELIGRRTGILDGDPGRLDRNRLDIEEEQQAEIIARQVQRVTLAASSALRGFANPPGRKVMLLMSGGWPYNPAVWVTGDLRLAAFATNVPYGDQIFKPLVETANRLSYTLYPVDVQNETYDPTGAERAAVDPQLDRDLLFNRLQDERATLSILADETGGEPLLGGSRLAALERAAADTRTYYWIGFTPDWKGDDASHRIAVKAREKGLKVRAREGFSDLSRQHEVTMMVESSLLFGGAPAASPLYAEVGDAKKAGRGKVQVPLTVIVPVSELTFLPRGDQFLAELELRIAVQDENGHLAEIPVVPMTVALEESPREGELRRYDTTLKLRNKKHDVVVSLYDIASGKILSARLAVNPNVG